MDAERRFKELEAETKKLHEESKKYFDAINGMLKHQIGFSKAVEEVYHPITGRESDPDAAIPEGNPEGIQASEQYREIVTELLTTLEPELEMIETRVILPADELLKVIQAIRKMAGKRDRKQLDLDRHVSSLAKLRAKKEPSIKDEKNIYTLENNVEIATQEFDYYNNTLKEELPQLFQLEADFIKPLFQSFYYMQLNIFYTIYSRMEEMKIPYFDMTSDVLVAFEAKRGDVQEQTEAISITQFRVGSAKAALEMNRKKFSKGSEASAGSAATTAESAPPPYNMEYASQQQHQQQPQPAYGQPPQQAAYGHEAGNALPGYGQPGDISLASGPQAYNDSKRAPPPVPPQPTAIEYCSALYEYVPQAQGDLAIKPGDVIEIVQRTADPNGWWTGKLNGQVGVFPGNYVQLR